LIIAVRKRGGRLLEPSMTLKQCLKNYPKHILRTLGSFLGLDFPEKLKKVHLVKHLNKQILSNFREDFIFLTNDDLKTYTLEFAAKTKNSEIKTKNEGDDSALDDFYDIMHEMNNDTPSEIIDNLSFLIKKGYIIDNIRSVPPVIVPSDLREIVIQRTKNIQGVDYHQLQDYIFIALNLYGYCTYQQLHDMLHHYTEAVIPLDIIRDYTMKFAEKRGAIRAQEDSFYDVILYAWELDKLIKSDQKTYYFPTREELTIYSRKLFPPQAMALYDQLMAIIEQKTKNTLSTSSPISYQEAVEGNRDTALDAYSEIFEYIALGAKMGFDLNAFTVNRNDREIVFNSPEDEEKANALYLELLKQTRKWPLKGFLYSETTHA